MSGAARVGADAAFLQQLLPRLAGIGITRLADVTGLDRVGLPVVLAVRPLGPSLAVSQGQGLDRDHACIAAVLEALELHCAARPGLALRYGSAAALVRHLRLADPERLPRRHGASVDRRRPLLWAEGVDLADGLARWVPYELVHTDFTVPQ